MTLPVTAGNPTPLDSEAMRAILQRFLPQVQEAEERAAGLRKRVLSGETQINRLRSMQTQGIPTNISEPEMVDAEERLSALRLELRQHEAWIVVGLGMALARGVAALLAEAGRDEGWRPPEGSVLRLVMPGLLNLSVDLHDQSFRKTQ